MSLWLHWFRANSIFRVQETIPSCNMCVLLGYILHHKGYFCYDPCTNCLCMSPHVIFEHLRYCAYLSPFVPSTIHTHRSHIPWPWDTIFSLSISFFTSSTICPLRTRTIATWLLRPRIPPLPLPPYHLHLTISTSLILQREFEVKDLIMLNYSLSLVIIHARI